MMKKLISLALCLILCLTAFTVPAYAFRITEAQKAYAQGGGDALWELVNTHYAGNLYRKAGYADLYIWQPEGPAFATYYADEFQPQTMYKVNMRETAGVGFTLEQLLTYQVTSWGVYIEFDQTDSILRDGPVHIDPCGLFSYNAGCPADGNPRYEIIVAAGTDDNGHPLEFYGVIQRLNTMPENASVVENPAYDTENLRHEADFEVEVAEGVWWVPVNTLGKSRYTNREIAGMTEHTPEQKREEISTLYEALQLFQISNFSNAEDNVRIMEGGINWEHHKPGYDAVRTNCGCCASDSNWLNYILSGDYEQVGFIAYSQPDGSGHVFNYIFRDDWYYFIDLTHYRTDFMDATRPESGSMSDYNNSDFTMANLHKVKEPEAFVKYCVDSYNDPPARYFLYQAENCLPLDGVNIRGQMTITYPEGVDIKVMDGKNPQKLDVAFVPWPKQTYKWSSLQDARIRADEKYLGPEEETGTAGPLTAYQPGDTLTLEDYGQNGFAVIDGIDYSACKTHDVCFGFEPNLMLYGGNHYSYYDLELPFHEHEALKDMDSLVLGDLTAGIVKKIPETQIVICVRDGDKLTVQEVEDGQHYDSRPICIYRETDGRWPATPEYWYLLICRSGETLYQFGRFKCW